MTRLSKIIPLIHYSELTKPDWRIQIFEQFILISLWVIEQRKQMEGTTPQEIRSFLKKELDASISRTEIQEILKLLESKGKVRKHKRGYSLAEDIKDAFVKQQHRMENLENELRSHFKKLVIKYTKNIEDCLYLSRDVNSLWRSFMDDFFTPLVRDFGAYVYNFLTYPRDNLPSWQPYLDQWLSKCCSSFRCESVIRKVLLDFLESEGQTSRIFFMRYIRAYFLLTAIGLPKNIVRIVTNSSRQGVQFTIFADTNFLFSILGLHDNPSNEAALDLIDLIREASKYIKIDLAVSHITLDEAKRSLSGVIEELGRYNRYSPNIASALLKLNQISGLRKRFFEHIVQNQVELSAEEFFHPYQYLDQILQEKGIIIYHNNSFVYPLEYYKESPSILEDIDNQLDYEQQRYKGRAKTRRQLEHDIILWHMVQDLRSKHISDIQNLTVLQMRYWIATIDYRFISFDRYRIKYKGDLFPVSMHPVQLIQILRFFVPLSDAFDKVLVKMISLPLRHESFDSKEEQIAVKIAKLIALYNRKEDLSEESIIRILANQSIRSKIDNIKIEEDLPNLIDSVLVEEIAQIEAEKESLYESLEKEKRKRRIMQDVLSQLQRKEEALKNRLHMEQTKRVQVERTLRKIEYMTKKKEVKKHVLKRLYMPLFLVVSAGMLISWYLCASFRKGAFIDISKILIKYRLPIIPLSIFCVLIISMIMYAAQSILVRWYDQISRYRRYIKNTKVYRTVKYFDIRKILFSIIKRIFNKHLQ